MTRLGVRSEALVAAAGVAEGAGGELGAHARVVSAALARCRPPPLRELGAGAGPVLAGWLGLEALGVRVLGPAGVAGEALALEALAMRLRLAARAYAEVEAGVAAVMRSVAGAADLAARGGVLTEQGTTATVRVVPGQWAVPSFADPGDLVAAGRGLEGGRVRVVEVAAEPAGSAWVVVVPGTQRWSPVAGSNPFDLTTDVRGVTGEEETVAAVGVAAALDRARARSSRARADDPVLLVGHSQGGILAAALAADPAFSRGHRVTHVLTTGAPVGLVPVPATVHVLSVEHAEDPVPTLDLTPNPSRSSWSTLRAGRGPASDPRRHALDAYVTTTRAAAGAPRGTVPAIGAWTASAGAFLGRPVLSVTEVVVERGWQNPRP